MSDSTERPALPRTTRAKLFVSSVKRQAGSPDSVQVELGAVTRGEENKTWAEATPQAHFNMTIQNPDAAVTFRLGQEFYVDFTPVGEPVTLADDHEYLPSDYEQANGDRYGTGRCQACGAKRASHEEPTRSKLVEWRP